MIAASYINGWLHTYDAAVQFLTKVQNASPSEVKKLIQSPDHKQQLKKSKTACLEIFQEFDKSRMVLLASDILASETQSLEMPFSEFESKYGKIKPKALGYAPRYSVIKFLPGRIFLRFPENIFAKDLVIAYNSISELEKIQSCINNRFSLREFDEQYADGERLHNVWLIHAMIDYFTASCFSSCFNLTEAYLSSIIWRFLEDNSRELPDAIKDDILKSSDRSIKYRLINTLRRITGVNVFTETDEIVRNLDSILFQPRHALTHCSPFPYQRKHIRFDEKEKIAVLFSMTKDDAKKALDLTINAIKIINKSLPEGYGDLNWLPQYNSENQLSMPGLSGNYIGIFKRLGDLVR